MVKYFLIVLIGIQSSFLTQAQDFDFDVPVKLPETINTVAEEGMPVLSTDSKNLYFTRFATPENEGGQFSGTDVWVSQRKGNTWTKATNKNLPFNSKDNNGVAGASAEGTILYITETSPYKKVKGIFFTKKKNDSWSDVEFIAIPGIENQGHIGFFVSPDFTVILISMKGSDTVGEEDLYFSLRDQNGKWSLPKNLGPTINTPGFEMSPFLSADKNRLYFSSNGHGGLGDADIFYSERLYNSWNTWSVPKNLGEKINSKMFDAFFTVYDSVAFFASNRAGSNADIYAANIRFKNKNILKDSVNRIIAETKKMLTDLQVTGKPTRIETSNPIVFDQNSIVLTAKAKNQLDYLIKRQDKVQHYEIVLYSGGNDDPVLTRLLSNRSTTIINYFVAHGVKAGKVITIVGDDPQKNSIEIKMYLAN
jgi:hypothetical protein